MSEEKICYQFTPVPTNLFILLDLNCKSVLFALIQLSSYYAGKDGFFFRTIEDLTQETGIGQRVVNAACSALHRAGIITVNSVGKSKGKVTNYYRVNFDRFKDFERYSLDELKNPTLKIETDPYKTVGYTPCYLEETSSIEVEQPKVKQSNNNIDNKEIEDNISNNSNNKIIISSSLPISNISLSSSTPSNSSKSDEPHEVERPIFNGKDAFNRVIENLEKYEQLQASGLEINPVFAAFASLAKENWFAYVKCKEYMRHKGMTEILEGCREIFEELNEKYRPRPTKASA